jgi:hypothetical protein
MRNHAIGGRWQTLGRAAFGTSWPRRSLPLFGSGYRAFEQLNLHLGLPRSIALYLLVQLLDARHHSGFNTGRYVAEKAPLQEPQKEMKQVITHLSVGGRRFFSMREMTSARFQPSRCASSACDRPHPEAT